MAEPSPAVTPDRRLQSALWMILAVTLWTLVAVCVRMLEGRVPISDLSFYRALLSVAVMMPLIRRAGRMGHGGPLRKAMPWFVLRGLFIFTAQTCFYFALTWMPMAEATVLSGTTPIFLALLAGMFLGEKVSPVRWAAIGLGFAGIVLILRPGAAVIQIAALTALASAVLFASSSAINKHLSRTEPASRIVGWTNLMIGAAAAIPFVYNSYVPQWNDVAWIAAIAVLGTGAQYSLARAIAAADASFSGPFDFLRMPFAALAGLILFAEWPDIWVWVGTGIVFASIFGLTRDRALFRHRTGASSG